MRYNYTYGDRSYSFGRPLPESYEFESWIDSDTHLEWMKKHWHYSIYISFAYLILILSLQHYMKSRPSFEIRYLIAIWNGALAVFSTWCSLTGLRILRAAIPEISFRFYICDGELLRHIPAITFWGWAFLYSKAFELMDTVFIVLNKRKLIFLHCYHHAVTLVLAWYLTAKEVSALALMGYANICVHSLMYTYFTFKALNYKIPRRIAMAITVVQTGQMVTGALVSIYAYWLVKQGEQCDSPSEALECAFCIYISYGLLFAHLFYTSYVRRGDRHEKKA